MLGCHIFLSLLQTSVHFKNFPCPSGLLFPLRVPAVTLERITTVPDQLILHLFEFYNLCFSGVTFLPAISVFWYYHNCFMSTALHNSFACSVCHTTHVSDDNSTENCFPSLLCRALTRPPTNRPSRRRTQPSTSPPSPIHCVHDFLKHAHNVYSAPTHRSHSIRFIRSFAQLELISSFSFQTLNTAFFKPV